MDPTQCLYFPPSISSVCSFSEELYTTRLAQAVEKNNMGDINHYFHRLQPLPYDDLVVASVKFVQRISIFKDKDNKFFVHYKQALQTEFYAIIKGYHQLRQHIEDELAKFTFEESRSRYCAMLSDLAFELKDRELALLMCDIMNTQKVYCFDIKPFFTLFLELCAEGNKDWITCCLTLMQLERPNDDGSDCTFQLIEEALEESKTPDVLINLLKAARITKNEELLMMCLVVVYNIYNIRKNYSKDENKINLYTNIPYEQSCNLIEMQPWIMEILLVQLQSLKESKYDCELEGLIFFLHYLISKHDTQVQAILRLLDISGCRKRENIEKILEFNFDIDLLD